MKLKNQQGFTLLELLVVVAVMAVIAGAAMMSMSGQEERAGQGVAMHTMQTVQNAANQFKVINKKIPNNLESILCTFSAATGTAGMTVNDITDSYTPDADEQDNTLINNAAGTGTGASITASNAVIFGGLSDAGLIGGGLTNSFAKKLIAVNLPKEGVDVLFQAGLTTLQFADAQGCDDLDDTASKHVDVSGVSLDEYPFVNSAFDDNFIGFPVTLDNSATAPMMIYEEPLEIGGDALDIIVVLGVGNSSELVKTDGAGFLAKAPRDGNVAGDKYGHFSLAYKIGTFTAATGALSSVKWDETPTLRAALDADGDYYEGEIAEFAGLEDE